MRNGFAFLTCATLWKGNGESGLFGFWRRFGSVTGFSNLRLRRSLAKNQKSSLRNGHSIFLNVLAQSKVGAAGCVLVVVYRPAFAALRRGSLCSPLLSSSGEQKLVAGPGIEPGTQGFSVLCSTN